MNCNKIKLIIWDLDDTFWKGTLSEGAIYPISENIELVKTTTDCGVINSICSKNDSAPVLKELERLEVLDFFVSPVINWNPKGKQICELIKELGLRPENVLFIDDNINNIKETVFFCPDIITALPSDLPELYSFFSSVKKTDIDHKRLKQYRVVERKNIAKHNYNDNHDFLLSCNIKVQIRPVSDAMRIHDLINRSNQLNFTKIRLNLEELQETLADKNLISREVYVKDNFGDYGVIGFFCLDSSHSKLVHFVFSCRTIGMGIEQYVYNVLKRPRLEIVQPVVAKLDAEEKVDWISEMEDSPIESNNNSDKYYPILFKGPCDIRSVFNYIGISEEMCDVEFTYIEKDSLSIESYNHTSQILSAYRYSDAMLLEAKKLPFYGTQFFSKKIFSSENKVVFFSMFTDSNLGVYKNKEYGFEIAFGEYCYDLTNEANWSKYLSGEIFNSGCVFSLDDLKYIKEKYVFLGRLSPQKSFENIVKIRELMPKKTKLVLFLGVEKEYEKNKQEAYINRHLYYQEVNRLIEDWCSRTHKVEVNKFTHNILIQNHFMDNINHFMPSIYFKVATDCKQIVSSIIELDNSSTRYLLIKESVKQFIKKLIRRKY